MRICFLLPYCSPHADPEPSAYLDRFPILRGLPQQVARHGHQIEVVLQHRRSVVYREQGVRYHLVAEGRLAERVDAALATATGLEAGHMLPARATIARALSLKPDLVHVHGLVPHLGLAMAGRALAAAATPWVAQYHGGAPARNRLVRRLQRRSLARPSALLFTSRSLAQPYVDAGLLPANDTRIMEVVETSSGYRPSDRALARRQTGFGGNPMLLSVARLHPVKDPLTVLRGFELIAPGLPEAQLHMVFRGGEMLEQVTRMVRRRPQLRGRVTLHGTVPAERMEAIYNSADFLLQASLREYSGCAVLEAMACGVVPVISDIPAFGAMLGPELARLLFPLGDEEAMARRVRQEWEHDTAATAAQVQQRFEQHLSFPAMASRLVHLYERLEDEGAL